MCLLKTKHDQFASSTKDVLKLKVENFGQSFKMTRISCN